MKLPTIILALAISIHSMDAQQQGRLYVDNWILNTFSGSMIDSTSLYVLNGLVIQEDSIELVLNRYKPKDFAVINYVSGPTIDKLMLEKPHSGIILLVTTDKQSFKSIKYDLERAKKRFKEYKIVTTSYIDTSKNEPVLIINGKAIFHTNCFKEINDLNARQIKSINYITQPVSEKIYGTNAVNGLIIINKK
jgi:hypothetical protein